MCGCAFQQLQVCPFFEDVPKCDFDFFAESVLVGFKRDAFAFPKCEHERFRLFSVPGHAFGIGDRFVALREFVNVGRDTPNISITHTLYIPARAYAESDTRLVVPVDEVVSREVVRFGEVTDFVVGVPVRGECVNGVLEHIGFGVLGREMKLTGLPPFIERGGFLHDEVIG